MKGNRSRAGPFVLLSWLGRIMAKGVPKTDNRLLVLIEFPYILFRAVVFTALIVPILVLSVAWLLLRIIFVLPRTIMAAIASKTTLTAGSHVAGSPEPVRQAQPEGDRDGQLDLMGDGDRAAVTAGALTRAAELWQLWQRSTSWNDSDLMRPATTEGFWRVHRLLLEVRADSGVKRVFDGRIVNSTIVDATHSGIVDELRVRLTCEGTCYDHTVGPEVVLRGPVGESRWAEELTLRRMSDVAAIVPAGAVPSTCANCGAPLDVDPAGACRICRALIAGRPGGWVLVDAWREQW